MVKNYLNELGFNYGDFAAHDGLWQLAAKTKNSCLERMALVPRIMEARGLDVSPLIQKKLASANKSKAVEILQVIEREEVFHVKVGNSWFTYLCAQQGLKTLPTFIHLIEKHNVVQIKPPFARENRLKAGFSEEELNFLEDYAVQTVN